ncbi:hypothetical protein Tsubulata_001787 [Turnera subulata]|uniref:Telomere-associated protein Rif1 N-terminal domain-containing protein n=1 Tax=Turnera subulata TaxID=218843 RepID=A0A9Q0FIK4_9ROSI|nr:hypothetical protein Tsubulata_001787 [Turnera subulata]
MSIHEIKSLINSNSRPNKSLGYSTLLLLQEQSTNDLSSLQSLADVSPTLISTIIVDVSDDDEEIAAQALKCLGFMIYHPSIVSLIQADDVRMILEALAKVIVSTRMKSVCNIGVWCISMQQFNTSFLDASFQPALRAVIYALENPVGSLSTSFEAMQAIIKLATQLTEKMRESSHIWTPPIYRRLLSIDKRERDMSERCLLKTIGTIFPPSAALSKAVADDIRSKLLAGMSDLLNQGMKVQTLHAWGWYIRLLGSYAMKYRRLINNMLKIPEQTFSDPNSQIQISSLVAWEALIDALVHPVALTCESDGAIENGFQQVQICAGKNRDTLASGLSKSIKLIMTPLVGIISSKCDDSVHLSCLNTWSCLLQKLGTFISHPSMIEHVLDPIFYAIFHMGPDSDSVWLWNLCLDMLDEFILAKCGGLQESSSQVNVNHHSLDRTSIPGSTISSKCSWRCPIKWPACPIDQLGFFVKMISILISRASVTSMTPENRSLACHAALRIFRSLLKRIQIEFKSLSISYNDIMMCLTTILMFIKKTSEGINSEGSSIDQLYLASFRLIEVVIEELEPSLLGCPLYKVALDIRSIEKPHQVNVRCDKLLHINCVAHLDMVSPSVYLVVLYISLVILSTSNAQKMELILPGLPKFFKVLLCTHDALENLYIINGLLYKHVGDKYLQIWLAVAEGLKECIHDLKDLSLCQMDTDCNGYLPLCHLLLYPFVVCSDALQKFCIDKATGSWDIVESKLKLKDVTVTWMSLYNAICASNLKQSAMNSFSEDLFSLLNKCMGDDVFVLGGGAEPDLSYKDLDSDLLSFCGNAVTCALEQILILAATSEESKDKLFSGITSRWEFASRFLKMSRAKMDTDPSTALLVTSRVLSALAGVVSRLHSAQTILSLVEKITCPLLQWLSLEEMQDGNAKDQLQSLWAEILSCLRRSQPPIVFDSTFLKLQAPLLQITLDHPNPTISALTIAFWNNTYGERINLDYPENLLDLLDKLSRHKRINLHKKSFPFLVKCYSVPDEVSQRYRVTAKNARSSKRVELMDGSQNQFEHKDEQCSRSKRRRSELTENQKEVRRAQQGRGMDCSGHGPGIRTYTAVDFSQGNEDSQESQEF